MGASKECLTLGMDTSERDRHRFYWRPIMRKVFDLINKFIDNPRDITASRLSVINGKSDFTNLAERLVINEKSFLEVYVRENWRNSCDVINEIAKIVMAEIKYQTNDCYGSLILCNSALAFLEEWNNVELWAVAKYIQLCIMIVTGQLGAIYPLVDSMKDRIYSSENKELIANYECLRAWCALYDGDWEIIDQWMETGAPNEFQQIECKDSFALLVKARIYYTKRKYMSAINLLGNLQPVLEKNARQMELCELYLLYTMSVYANGNKEEAFDYLRKCFAIASERGFYRLIADEGDAIYRIILDYTKRIDKEARKDVFLVKVKKQAKEMALMYSTYLREEDEDLPTLTKKEKEILKLIVEKKSNVEIAEYLDNSLNTVKFHVKNIFKKLEVTNRKEAIEVALSNKIV